MAKRELIIPKKEIILPGNTMPSLNELLMKDDKKGLFKRSNMSLGFPTGFLPLDYRNGYTVNNFNDDDDIVSTYNNIGIFGGTFNTVIGKSGVAKTTFVAQASANVGRYVKHTYGADVETYHFDVEQASNLTRIKKVTNLRSAEMKKGYFLYQDSTYIEDIYTSIVKIAAMKEQYKSHFTIKTNIKDEYNEPISTYVPTIIIIDSLPSLSIKESEGKEELEGGTYANRVAKAISRFYKSLVPLVKKYNFIVFVINHINTKIEINPMAKTQPQLLYLKMDESLPGGAAPIYYAHNIFKFVTQGKFTTKDDGFDGFLARCELLKSRSNKAGKECYLVYDQDVGFDPYLTLYKFLDMEGKVEGRNPYRYITGHENAKFDARDFRTALESNKDLYNAVYDSSVPILQKILSNTKFNDVDSPTDIGFIYNRLAESFSKD